MILTDKLWHVFSLVKLRKDIDETPGTKSNSSVKLSIYHNFTEMSILVAYHSIQKYTI